MTCNHCKIKITEALKKVENVKNINFDGHIAEIEYNGEIDKQKIINEIIKIDYYTNSKMISDNKRTLKENVSIGEFFKIISVFLLLSFVLNKFFKFNIFNAIPVINSDVTYAMLFVIGLITSIHCVSMCGAINLIASTSDIKNFKKPILYNLGRLTSYTIIGGIVGIIGSTFKVNIYFQGIIIIIASIVMLLISLHMMGMINFSLRIKPLKVFNNLKTKNSFILGLSNGLMPCGPLQAMQVYALSTGSFVYGALSMFIFCLGTIPLMLFMGMISNFLNNKNRKILNKMSTVLILLLSIVMLNRGLLSMGVDISNIFKPNYDNYLKSKITEDYQIVEFDLKYDGYEDIVVQKGIPVKMIINVTKNTLTGCNNGIKINGFNITKDLRFGKNIIEFTPNETKTFTYTCWMGMLKNNIVVVDDPAIFEGVKLMNNIYNKL